MKKTVLIFSAIFVSALLNVWFAASHIPPWWMSPVEHFFIGGMAVAWLVISGWRWREPLTLKNASSLKFFEEVFVWTACIGVLWEIFEYVFFQHGMPNQQWFYDDTMQDLMLDLIGGSVAARIYMGRRRW